MGSSFQDPHRLEILELEAEGSAAGRPEHRYYAAINDRIRSAISCGEDILFDTTLLQEALQFIWKAYGVPYEVRPLLSGQPVSASFE